MTHHLLTDHVQTADWKSEKHVPIIDCPDQFKKDEFTKVTVTIGKAVAHPNTTEHHIRWIVVYFLPEGSKFAFQVGRMEFCAHGESAGGPNTGPVYTHHEACVSAKINLPGTLFAVAYCNIHGLWQSSKDITVA